MNALTSQGIEYIPLKKNTGIAYAQNVGIKFAFDEGYEYVLLLDQDSIIDVTFVKRIKDEYEHIKELHSDIGYLGPVFIDDHTHVEYKNYIPKKCDYVKVDSVIASGCLISMETLRRVGGMDDSLYIDLVDFEWCWRAGNHGYSGYITRNVNMVHSIGKEYHNWHGFVLGISAPFRYYYQYRNTLWLARRGYVPFKWKVKSILRRTIDIFIVPLASDNGCSVLKNMLKGIKDGIFMKNILTY